MSKNFVSVFIILLSSTCLVQLQGCYYDNEELLYGATASCDSVQAGFSVDVSPIVSTKCAIAGCHNAATGAGSAVLTNHAEISAKAARIKDRAVVQKSMPPSGFPALTDAELNKLRCWIESGAPNN
jgi:uncharacterized membrane protein